MTTSSPCCMCATCEWLSAEISKLRIGENIKIVEKRQNHFVFSQKVPQTNFFRVFKIYLHVVGPLYILGPGKIAMSRERERERGRKIKLCVLRCLLSCPNYIRVVWCVCVYARVHKFFYNAHVYISIVPKKLNAFSPRQRNNISSNVPAIIICEKNILKINENELHYTRAADCIRGGKKNWKTFFFCVSPWNKINHRRNIAENNLIVF